MLKVIWKLCSGSKHVKEVVGYGDNRNEAFSKLSKKDRKLVTYFSVEVIEENIKGENDA